VQTDYYEILGVTRSASPEEIKAAYRRLAQRFHPDTSSDPGAEDRFKEITLAYQVLRDMEKRVRYDLEAMERELEATERELRATEPELSTADTDGGSANPTVHLGDTLPPEPGADTIPPQWERGLRDDSPPDRRVGLFQRFGRRRAERPETTGERVRGDDYEAIAQITLEEAIRGATVTLAVAGPERPTNGGSGSSARTVEVRVPKLAVDGQRLRLKGQGGPGVNGGSPGDLYAKVTYKRHELFRLLGTDVWFYLPIAPWEAVLGAVVDIEGDGAEVEYVTRGTIYPMSATQTRRDAEAWAVNKEFGVEVLEGSDVHALEPALSPKIRHAIFVRGDHWLNNQRFVLAYAQAAAAAGVELSTGCNVSRLVIDGGRVRAVVTEGEHVEGDAVLLAAGAWSSELMAPLGAPLRSTRDCRTPG